MRTICVDLLAFFADRLKVQLREQGARHDLVDAVFALGGQDDLLLIVRRVEALGRFLETEDGANAPCRLSARRRTSSASRRRRTASSPSAGGADPAPPRPSPRRRRSTPRSQDAKAVAAEAVAGEDFEGAMAALARLRAPVDLFFDKILVNAPDPTLRLNRLRLLDEIRAATREVADFSQIGG